MKNFNKLNKPCMLKKGDTIGIINPAFKNQEKPFETYDYMIIYFKKRGYKLKFGESFEAECGYLAGTDEVRARDIMNMFTDKEVKAIICMRGGYGANRILDKLDYKVIAKNPKIFSGFSDITALLNAIFKKANVPTIHGLISLFVGGKNYTGITKEDFIAMLTFNQLNRVITHENIKTMVSGEATGTLVGGNLSLIASLSGTPFEVDMTDKIVLIEEVEEEPYQIDRYLSTLALSGMLQKAKGFILGYFTDCNPSEKRKNAQSTFDIINEYIKKLNKPTIYDFPTGHSFPFINLPIGINVSLDATKKTITIKEEFYNGK